MKKYIFLFLYIFISCLSIQTKANVCISPDANNSEKKENIIEYGKLFHGKPYVPHTLEKGDDHSVIVNLEEFDCTTFVETVLALYLSKGQLDKDFTDYLTLIRYRNGKPKGYASRLHYFSDWIVDNEQKGLLKDLTKDLGGNELKKPINFMSSHREKYKGLSSQRDFEEIKQIETKISKSVRYVIPKENIQKISKKIEEGDITGLVTKIKGLDFVHLGIATKNVATGAIHLLHASSKAEKVIISKETISKYITGRKEVSGIVILRVIK